MGTHVSFEGKLVCLYGPPGHRSNDAEVSCHCGIRAITPGAGLRATFLTATNVFGRMMLAELTLTDLPRVGHAIIKRVPYFSTAMALFLMSFPDEQYYLGRGLANSTS